MNFLGGFSIPQHEEFQLDGWNPAKPQKTAVPARFDTILDTPVDNQPGPENWTQMVPNYDSLAQIFDTGPQMGRIPGQFGSGGNMVERNPATNNIPDPYQQRDWNNIPLMELLLGGDSSDCGVTERSDLRMAPERPLIPNRQAHTMDVQEHCSSVSFGSGFSYQSEFPNLHSQNERDWIGSRSDIQFHCNQREALDNRNVNGLTQELLYDSPTPSKPIYDLNLSPTINAAHLANDTNLLLYTPFESSQKQQSDSRLISDEDISRGKEISGNLVQCADGTIQQNCNQFLQNIVDSSSTVVSTPVKETAISEMKGDLGIDLNETPQQKPPKRRKHRPKVVREGKSRRTPKPAVPKNPESYENRPGKRKYVRKKLPRDSGVEVIDLTGETAESNSTSVPKACKRVLSFNLEEINKNNLDMAVPQEISSGDRGHPDGTISHQSIDLNGTRIMSTVQSEVPTGSESQTPNSRHEIDGTANQQQTRETCTEGIGKANLENVTQVDPSDLQRVKDLMRSAFQPVPKTPYKSSERRGSKRDHSQTVKQARLSAKERMASSSNGNTLHNGQEKDKKSGSGDGYRQIKNMSFNCIVTEGGIQKHDLNLMSRNLEQSYSAVLNSQYNTSRLEEFTSKKYVQSIASGHESHTGTIGSTSAYNPLTASLQVNSTGQGHFQMVQTNYISTPDKNHTIRSPIQEKPTKRRGTKEKIPQTTPIEEITYRLQILDLNGNSAGLQNSTNQNALVPYQGGGTLVPYQGDILKKRKPRPKVDLDSETNRIWNLLMGKEGSEKEDAADDKKEKWWEEERKVFRGRVDSFIARMHLVQGDRRFSRWKGSVVDSVIGVFLTQNVSDHLSSSAFMSMAARFPLKPRTQVEAMTNVIDLEVPIAMLNPDEAIRWHEVSSKPTNQNRIPREPVQHLYGNDTTGTSKEAPNQSSEEEFMLSQDSFNSSLTEVVGGIRSSSGSNSETEDPSIGCKPGNGQVSALPEFLLREKSSSAQEVCSQVNGWTVLDGNSKYGPINLSQTSAETMRHLGCTSSTIPDNPDHLHRNDRLTNNGVSELWLCEPFSEESTSSWQSPPSTSAKGPETVSKSSRTEKSSPSFDNSSREQIGPWWFHETPTTSRSSPDAFFSIDFTNQSSFAVPIPNTANNQSSCISDHQMGNKTVPVKSNISIEPEKHTEALNELQNSSKLAEMIVGAGDCSSAANSHVHSKNKLVEANSNETISPSSQPSTVAKTKNPKPRKAKAEDKKKNAVDWDELRKNVKISGRETERTKDSMDSLDYEAVRTANVKDISDTIKERGMNNMLAERMKEFLNRVVKDHGSIDLEWLRDVPPDKAKDYLLSIRGLGLKSVECVRLLTLHHLAFPVDTNVGRIAVRLGWVPLQPLPESLQLHLLELYPILESIQKYLWPRLCKLDQRTLYELHYQMITFGKVFCTKSKPNCNACPMRGECRHFASAFASARLALPGPEDRSIVSSNAPQTEDSNPGVVIHPMALPAPDHSSFVEVGSSNSKRCEPIIEEPASPEQQCIEEIALSDIEDFEDPNEIPIIELDIKEFTENLQNYMQNNMELQEADMSKALVALNPNMTHIPIPKLKNISRLRTEHQVYELPDSHPLLEQFDSREPDDPSPYLLAIWTPGETANSIQPPEKCCGSESDNLCSDPTCFSCSSVKESNSQTVRGTILIPCRTAMRGSFPLNGTYFQVNEMFADHKSSHNPIDVPRKWIWNLPRRTVYFGTSVSSIFKGLTTPGIQYCFWKGFVCVRGFEHETRAPRPMSSRLHFVASKLTKTKKDEKE